MKHETPIAKLSPEKGFEWFFNEYWAALRYYAFKFTNDADVAEDAAQRAFIALHENGIVGCHIKKPDDSLKNICKSWLYTTTRNWCLNWLKAEMAKKVHLDNILRSICEDEDYIIQNMSLRELSIEMRKAIETLPSECRKVFISLFIYGNTVRQTSEILGVAISTVKNQKARGLDALQDVVSIQGQFIGSPNKSSEPEQEQEKEIDTSNFIYRWNNILLMDGLPYEIKEAKWRLYQDMHKVLKPREISALLGVCPKHISYTIHCLSHGKLKFRPPKKVKKPMGRKPEMEAQTLITMSKESSIKDLAKRFKITHTAMWKRIMRAKEHLEAQAAICT